MTCLVYNLVKAKSLQEPIKSRHWLLTPEQFAYLLNVAFVVVSYENLHTHNERGQIIFYRVGVIEHVFEAKERKKL